MVILRKIEWAKKYYENLYDEKVKSPLHMILWCK